DAAFMTAITRFGFAAAWPGPNVLSISCCASCSRLIGSLISVLALLRGRPVPSTERPRAACPGGQSTARRAGGGRTLPVLGGSARQPGRELSVLLRSPPTGPSEAMTPASDDHGRSPGRTPRMTRTRHV